MDLKVLELAANTENQKLLKNYDFILKQKNSFCGDKIEITIKIKNKKIYKMGYVCESCIYTQASASLLSNFLKNKSLNEYQELSQEIDKYFKKKTSNLPKKLSYFSSIMNNKNFMRKDCIMLPFITLNKMLKNCIKDYEQRKF